MSDSDGAAPVLVLGPLLRYVSETVATIWAETDRACRVTILGRETTTFEVAGHHYALAVIDGLEPGRAYEYQVALDGTVRWPEPDSPFPASVIRTLDPARPLRMVFGSCRIAELSSPRRWRRDRHEQNHGADALGALALDLRETAPERWPDIMLLIGDQVYADEVGPATRQFIRQRRDPTQPPGPEVKDFTEYCFLYREAWSEPAVRWLLSAIPSAMIFDDHDVHDDWNTSAAWRRDFQHKPWWRDRIDGAYMSYWIYQHLGNLSPDDLARDELWRDVRGAADAAAMLRDFAQRADESPAGIRWSYRRTFGRVRLVVIDARSGRVLDDGGPFPRDDGDGAARSGEDSRPGGERRQMVSDAEWQWVTESVAGDWDHVVLASSLPVLLPPGIHDVEAWNEAVCAGAWGQRFVPIGERIRRAADLEHWAAFAGSFTAFEHLLAGLAAGAEGTPPASVSVLGGDIHHSYVAEVSLPAGVTSPTRIYQLVCSPIHNLLPDNFRQLQRVITSRAGVVIGATLARLARVPAPQLSWRVTEGPWFSNMLASLNFDGRHARVRFDRSRPDPTQSPHLAPVHRSDLS